MTVNRYRDRDGADYQFHDTTTKNGLKVGRSRVGFNEDGLKPCSKCGEMKPRTKFYKDRSMANGYSSNCVDCRKAGRAGKTRRWDILEKKYGLTKFQFEELLIDQNFQCAICDTKFEGNEKGYESICVDHDHETNEVRGLLCRYCNIGLGKFKDNVESLRQAANYLENFYNK